MPYQSDAQRRFMHAKHPDIAARWDEEIRRKRRKKAVSKARAMTDMELRRRKKVGARLTQVTSGIGLASLGAVGAAAAAPKLARAGRLGKVTEAGAKAFQARTQRHLITTGAVASGIGGINGFNNAAWQAAEARKRTVRKAWSPMSSSFDAEARRDRRARTYQTTSGVTAAAAGVGAGAAGTGAHIASQRAKNFKAMASKVPNPTLKQYAGHKTHLLRLAEKNSTRAGHGVRAAVGLAALGATAGATHSAIQRKRASHWQPYAKSAHISAFGIDHSV